MQQFSRMAGIVLIGVIITPLVVGATAVQDDVAGTWTDAYADNTGLSLKGTANVNTGTGVLQLTNVSNGFTAPFRTSGTARTNSIIPEVIGAWDSITLVATIPTSTALTVQVLDTSNRAFSNTVLSGNGTGFSVTETGTTVIDISALQVDRMASVDNDQSSTAGSFPGIRVLFTLTTSDTAVTPSIDSVVVEWDRNVGNEGVASLDDVIVPSAFYNQQLTGESPYASAMYPVVRWMSDAFVQPPTDVLVASDGSLIVKKEQAAIGGVYQDGQVCSYDRDDGSELWCVSDNSPNARLLVTEDSIFIQEEYQDNLVSRDLSDGSMQWMREHGSGHFQEFPLVDFEGNRISVHSPGNGTATLEAIDGSGSVVWSLALSLSTPVEDRVVGAVLNDAGTRVFLRSSLYNYGTGTSAGKVIAIDLESRSVLWTQSLLPGRAGFALGSHIILDESLGYLFIDGYDAATQKYGVFALNVDDGEEAWRSLYDGHMTYTGAVGYDYVGMQALTGNYVVVIMGYYELDFSSDNYYLRVIDANSGDPVTELFFDTSFSGYAASANSAGYLNTLHTSYLEEDLSEYKDILAQRVVSDLSSVWSVSHPVNDVGVNTTLQEFYFRVRTPPIQDERGWIYVRLKTGDDANQDGTYDTDTTEYALVGIAPWTLSSSASPSSLSDTENVTFTVTTSMPARNPLMGEDNAVQVVFSNGDIIPLSFQSDNGQSSMWSGSYQIPFGTELGALSYTVEASQAGVVTDTSTSFSSVLTDSENTGIAVEGALSVVQRSTTSGITPIEPEDGFSVVINDGDAITDDSLVSLSINGGDRVKYMYVGEDDSLRGATRELYSPTRSWQLSGDDDVYTVYVQFETSWGLKSSIVSDSIVLDMYNDDDEGDDGNESDEDDEDSIESDDQQAETGIDGDSDHDAWVAGIQRQILLILEQIILLQEAIQKLLMNG